MPRRDPVASVPFSYACGMPMWHWLCRRQADSTQRLLVERQWRLGVHTTKRPQLIYADLHAAFLALGVLWKRTAPYNFRCRAHVPGPSGLVKLSPKGFGVRCYYAFDI
jgi:hypothetical protein